MNGNNFNDLSYKDRQLGNQINQVLNEYNSLARKIKESKKDYMTKNNYLNAYNFSKRTIPKSPYVSRQKDNIYNLYPFYMNYDNNRNNETFFGTNDLIEEFKDTLEKSQIIKDDILKSHKKMSRKKKYSNKISNYNKTPITYKRNYFIPKNEVPNTSRYEFDNILTSLNDPEESNYSNGGLSESIPNGQSINGGVYNNYNNILMRNKSNNIISKKDSYENILVGSNEKDKKKLEIKRESIINAYQNIKKENRILEVEINNYKKLANHYLKLIDLILNTQKQNESLSNKIKILNQKNKDMFQKIEQKNRKNAEIQILNEENEQNMIALEEDKNALIEELERNKIIMLKLKNKEDNLNMLNESKKKALHDNEEHIIRLKNTINQFNKYKENSSNKNNDNFNQLPFNNKLKVYNQKINNLKLEINNLITRKQKALFSKEYNKGKIRNSSLNNLDNNENELSQQLNLLKNENIIKNEHIKEKENQIEILKNAIDKVSLAMKTNEPQVAIQKMDITNLISDIENSENKSNLEEENNIKEQIKQMIAKNYQKNNEIHQLSQKYNKIINQKNLEINNLEMQLNQININNNLPMNNINPNLYSKVKVDSINELTLDDAYGQNNLK